MRTEHVAGREREKKLHYIIAKLLVMMMIKIKEIIL
jgi:hypothetical protein